MSPPSTFLIFELHQHDVPQKNTFFIENLDSEENKGWCKKNDTTIVKINIAAFSDYNCILYWLVKLITEFLSFQKAIQTIFIGFIDLVAQIYEHFGIDVFIHFIDFIFWPPTLTVRSLAAPWDTETYNTSLERSDVWLLSG